MDILTLRTALQSQLSSLLGTYTYANGSTTPAISVRAAGEGLPAGTTVTGMEVMIVRDPALAPVLQYQNEEAFREWTLYLVGWTPAAPLSAAAGKIVFLYPGASSNDVRVPEGLGPSAQKRVIIRSNPDGTLGSGQS
tara:strand:- start:4000 stop:4410 length:411 start_codon:yes stop_codon:yes gene_type:complete